MTANAGRPADSGTISDWCESYLGSAPIHSYITEFPAPQRWGFELADHRRIAVSVHHPSARLAACAAAHQKAYHAGIACPAPVAGPEPLGDGEEFVVLVESWRAEGAVWPTDDPAGSYGRLQARLVTALAGVDPAGFIPAPPWLRFDHRAAGRLWPAVDDEKLDPESVVRNLPAGLYQLGEAARERLLAARLPATVGHARLSGLNVRWLDVRGTPKGIIHGWEWLTARPEAVLAGYLAAMFNEFPDQLRIAPIVEGRQVLAAYQEEAGRDFSQEEQEVAWAASVWAACYFAAMEHVRGAAGHVTHQLMMDGVLRLHLAGC